MVYRPYMLSIVRQSIEQWRSPPTLNSARKMPLQFSQHARTPWKRWGLPCETPAPNGPDLRERPVDGRMMRREDDGEVGLRRGDMASMGVVCGDIGVALTSAG